MSDDKRFHIVSNGAYNTCKDDFVEGFDTKDEAKSFKKLLEAICDPHEVLSIIDTQEKL